MSNAFLQGLLRDFNDRTGYGVKTTQVNVNVEIATRLEAARRRAGLIEGPVIEGEVT
jgi:hypothetical protein